VLLGGIDISSLWYVLCVAGWSAYYAARDRNRAALHGARLEARVVEGRLAELGARLDPHFLFNALNTLTAVMYDDVHAAVRMLSALERLMIESFQREPTWSLRRERDHTLRFADFVHVRFGSRIRIVWADAPDLGEVHVPRFAVQTLVENAIKHNQTRRGPLLIEVRVEPDGGRSRISVIDDGAGFSPGADLGGRSLSRLSEMLGLLHSHRAEVKTFAPAAGGARVDIVVPREPAGVAS
jgi:LytS/YehU family sensor histidine kinase